VKSLTLDHLVPLAKGGTGLFANIVPACLSCNDSKGAKLLFKEWMPSGLPEAAYHLGHYVLTSDHRA
jgi:5-methylcytosine-specific restriction endonuclease McrA